MVSFRNRGVTAVVPAGDPDPGSGDDGLALTPAETELLQRARATFRMVAYGRDPVVEEDVPPPSAAAAREATVADPAAAALDAITPDDTARDGAPDETAPDDPARHDGAPDDPARHDTAPDDPAPDGLAQREILLASLDRSAGPIGVFSWPGGVVGWANQSLEDWFGDRAERTLVALLDEWSQAQFLVRALPDLMATGRWQGRLGFDGGPDGSLAMAVDLVAHHDEAGQIDALSLIATARPGEPPVGPTPEDRAEQLLAALVEHVSDLIVVTDPAGEVRFASPTARSLLDLGQPGDGGLVSLIHPGDRPDDLRTLATTPDEPAAGTSRLRLRAADGSWRQVAAVVTDLTGNPSVGGLVMTARDVTDGSDAILSLVTHALTDELTGLGNRGRLVDQVRDRRQADPGGRLAFLLVDLDRFRAVNEQHGPALTDTVLCMLAGRLADAAPPDAAVARLRSDEFAVVAPVTGLEAAVALADGLRDALRAPVTVGEEEAVVVSATVGVALAQDAEDDQQAIGWADHAMRRAKLLGGDQTAVHDGAAVAREDRRRAVELQLRHAIDGDGLQLRYQPVVDLRSGAVVGAEALLRIRTDDGELSAPGVFVEAAERAGVIGRVGERVLTMACTDLVALPPEAPLVLSINVSPRQLADPAFAGTTLGLLEAAGFDPRRLLLEITEGTLQRQDHIGERNIVTLRAEGVQLGLDEFGGSTSLGHLRRFPLDFVKVDRSLIAGLGSNYVDSTIVRSALELAQRLGLRTVAVGVESDAQHDRLLELGCDQAQGFLYGGPVAVGQLRPTP